MPFIEDKIIEPFFNFDAHFWVAQKLKGNFPGKEIFGEEHSLIVFGTLVDFFLSKWDFQRYSQTIFKDFRRFIREEYQQNFQLYFGLLPNFHRQNYSLLEQTVDILIKQLMKISTIYINIKC